MRDVVVVAVVVVSRVDWIGRRRGGSEDQGGRVEVVRRGGGGEGWMGGEGS